MSESQKNPFTMVGTEGAAACGDDVCEVPTSEPEPSAQV